jgi:hypothetical protein
MARPTFTPELARNAAQRSIQVRREKAKLRHPPHVPPPPPPETLEDVTRWHSWVTGALARGQIDKSVATGLAYNLQQHRAALQIRDLEREVLRLRETLAALKKGQQPGGTR